MYLGKWIARLLAVVQKWNISPAWMCRLLTADPCEPYLLGKSWVLPTTSALHCIRQFTPAGHSKLLPVVVLVEPPLNHTIQTPWGIATAGHFDLTDGSTRQTKSRPKALPVCSKLGDLSPDILKVTLVWARNLIGIARSTAVNLLSTWQSEFSKMRHKTIKCYRHTCNLPLSYHATW